MDFSAYELSGMRDAQESHMMDTCQIVVYAVSVNSFGEEIRGVASTVESRCGLDMRPGSERHGQDNTQLQYDATVRLPINTVVSAKDVINVTKRFGESITALAFEVVGVKQRGPSGIRLMLKRIEL